MNTIIWHECVWVFVWMCVCSFLLISNEHGYQFLEIYYSFVFSYFSFSNESDFRYDNILIWHHFFFLCSWYICKNMQDCFSPDLLKWYFSPSLRLVQVFLYWVLPLILNVNKFWRKRLHYFMCVMLKLLFGFPEQNIIFKSGMIYHLFFYLFSQFVAYLLYY